MSGGADDDLLVGGTGDDKLDGGSGADELWGQEGTDTLTGGSGDDFLDGGAGADRLYGGDGADEMWGEQGDVSVAASGDDLIFGEAGNDTLVGGAGNDTLDGGADNDALWGGVGNDTLTGGTGDDGLQGEDGNDTLSGGAGGDTLNGGDGADALVGGEGADYLEGGAGADTYVFNPGDGARNAQGQAESVIETGSDTTFVFGGGITRQNVTARKAGTTNNLSVFYGSEDAFVVTNGMSLGGATFRFSDGSTATLDEMLSAGLAGGSGSDSIQGYDNRNDFIDGGDGDDTISGGTGNDTLIGGSGNDTLRGDGGNDTLEGGIGNEVLFGGDGADIYRFNTGSGQDRIVNNDVDAPGANADTIQLDGGLTPSNVRLARSYDDLIISIAGAPDSLVVADYFKQDGTTPYAVESIGFTDGTVWDVATVKAKVLVGTDDRDWMRGFASADAMSGAAGDDWIYGAAGDDTLDGGDGADEIHGGDGNDTLIGGNGNDLLRGDDGADTYLFGPGSGQDTISNSDLLGANNLDTILLGAGLTPSNVTLRRNGSSSLVISIDGTPDTLEVLNYFWNEGLTGGAVSTIRFADGTVWNVATVKDKVLVGTAGDDYLVGYGVPNVISGGGGNDTIYGGISDDVLEGDAGNDLLGGGGGNDTLRGGAGQDHLDGSIGNDTLDGGDGDDLLMDLAGDDTLNGGAGNDILIGDQGGGLGNDVLDGGSGDDILIGASGADTYRFGIGSGHDLVFNALYVGDAGGRIDYGYYGRDDDPLGVNPDTILFGAGLVTSDIELKRSGDDLCISIRGTDDSLTMDKYFAANGTTASMVETIRFADGTVWDSEAVKRMVLNGSAEADVLRGYESDDVITGGDGNDSMYGSGGNDVLRGDNGDDRLFGDIGNDTLIGGSGSDQLYGGDGADIYHFGRGAGQDTIDNRDFDSIGTNSDTIQLGAELAESDIALSRVGSDLYVGIKGTADSIRVAAYFVDDGASAWAVEAIRFADGTIWDYATVVARMTPMNLVGTTADDVLVGGSLDDTLSGFDGNDTLDGRGGADAMSGGLGDDLYIVDRAPQVFLNWDGSGGVSPYSPPNQTGPWDSVSENAGEGVDTVVSSVDYALGPNIDNLTLTGTGYLTGIGNELDNVLTGGAGHDTLYGGAGADTMRGGFGDDGYVVDNPGDVVVENANAGYDWVASFISYSMGANIEDLELVGTANINGTGNDLDNWISGNAGNNVLTGGGGNDWFGIDSAGIDTLDGGIGNDTYAIWAEATGNKIISSADSTPGKTDTLYLDFDPLTTTVGRAGLDLQFSFAGSTATVTVKNYFATTGATLIERFEFVDETVWTPADVAAKLPAATDGDDNIVGTAADDAISALGGNDVVNAGDGNDTVDGGLGDDVLNGQNGIDSLIGGAGNDTLDGGAGNDSMAGGTGNDIYVVDASGDVVTEAASAGTDTVRSSVTLTLGANVENLVLTGSGAITGTGNSLNNILTGNAAGNVLSGGTGTDTMIGGGGDDTYVVDATGDVVAENAGEGNDLVQSSVTYTLSSGVENLTLTGTTAINGTGNALDNTLIGNSANNTLTGGDGNDTLDGGAGTDTLVGGLGNDTYIVDSTTDTITEAASAGTDTVKSSVTITLASNVENLSLTGTAAINGTGNTLNNTLTGNATDNKLDGGTGTDTMAGGAGNDTYVVDATGDVVTENAGEGTDLVQSAVTYTLSANVENLTLTGTTAINGTGNALANVLIGNSANNTLTGGDGNDSIDGGTGNDTMVGGLGDDTYTVNISTDVVTEAASAGTDTVLSSVTLTLAANVENLTLTGTTAINGTGNALDNLLVGNSANNTLTGGDGNDTLDGGAGTDTLVGGLGNDTYTVNVSTDIVTEAASAGTDTVLSAVTLTLATNVENLILNGTGAINGTGNSLANLVRGNAAVNTLNGGTGNDLLEGGDGNDILTDSSGTAWFNGGAGADTITGGASAEIFVGGLGNDTLNTGNGADIILYNKGEGSDTINGGTGTDNVLSLGGGLRYADLKFRKVTNDLVMDVSATESITFKNWYVTTANNKTVSKLQLMLEATPDYNAASTDPTLNKKVEQFDFAGLATQFDQALVATPTLTSWALTNALSTYYLTSSSDTAALGGDLAYYYGKNGNVAGMTTTAAQDVIGSASLGTANQTLRAFSGISGGANVLL
ncbi:MAG TPA: calcium-binding protein [Nitrospira sp.]|nr:calcium-binding protein [Nitrospira sp.]